MSTILHDLIDLAELAPRSRTVYRRCLNRWIGYAGADPAGWTPRAVADWRDELRSRLGPATTNKHLYALRRASRAYHLYGYGPDFAAAVDGVHNPGGETRKALTVGQVRRLLETCSGGAPRDLRDRLAIILGVRTGMRASELVGLRWEGIHGQIAEVAAKGRRLEQKVLDAECLRALEAWGGWLSSEGHELSGPVLRGVSQQGIDNRHRLTSSLSRKKLHAALQARGDAVGLRIYPHLLRHTFVSWALAAGVSPQRVMQQTGHRSLQTLSRYVTDLEAVSDPVAAHLPSLENEDSDDDD